MIDFIKNKKFSEAGEYSVSFNLSTSENGENPYGILRTIEQSYNSKKYYNLNQTLKGLTLCFLPKSIFIDINIDEIFDKYKYYL